MAARLPGAQMNLSIKTLAVTVAHADGTLEYDAHNLYGMYEVKSTALALRSIRGKRQFILTRCVLSVNVPPPPSCADEVWQRAWNESAVSLLCAIGAAGR